MNAFIPDQSSDFPLCGAPDAISARTKLGTNRRNAVFSPEKKEMVQPPKGLHHFFVSKEPIKSTEDRRSRSFVLFACSDHKAVTKRCVLYKYAYINLLPDQLRQLIRLRKAQNEEKAKTQTVLYHYASAISIGTALAQAWNPEVPEICGDIVGEEMELFGVNVWLATALNIIIASIILLVVLFFVYVALKPAVPGNYETTVQTGGDIEAKYLAHGSYEVKYTEQTAMQNYKKCFFV
jgi:hypothetical protein